LTYIARGIRPHKTTAEMRENGFMSRAEARSMGLPTYRTGLPCKHGHYALRRTKTAICKECARITGTKRMREHRHKSPEFRRRTNQAVHRAQKKSLAYKITNVLRSRMITAIKKGYRTGSAVGDLGCSISEFRDYIANIFQPGMTWDNWGKIWHLDHKKALSSFDLSDRQQFLEAIHFTNFQPLFISDHRAKTKIEIAAIRSIKTASALT
jgi:hypothetical protein